MAKKVEKVKAKRKESSNEQMDLIDVAPKNAKAIVRAARLYKELQATRLTALAEEITQKQHVLDLVRKSEVQPLEGGKIKFEYEGVTISVTPRDELLTVKDKTETE